MQTQRFRLDRGSDANGDMLMHHSCDVGNLSLVIFICDRYPIHSCNVPNTQGLYPIHIACQRGYIHIVRYLSGKFPLSLLTTQSSSSALSWTPLHFAVSNSSPAGRDVDYRSERGADDVVCYLLSVLPPHEVWIPDERGALSSAP